MSKAQKAPAKREGDDINWFGVKVGTGDAAFGVGAAGGGVGKYLNAKRPLEGGDGGAHNVKKKRKVGFGEFEGW